MKKALFALAVFGLHCSPIWAATKYWDINGPTAGASAGATATGAWDTGTTGNWSTDSTGGSATTTWAASDTAIFAAGTNATGGYTITATGTPVAAGITFEEGTITLSGRVDVNTGTVELKSGTQLITANSGGATGTGITLTAGGKYAITGDATLRTTNTGNGGSFVSSVGTIALSNDANLTVDYQVANTLSIVQTATIISGTGSLIKTGAGVIAIASPSTYSGSTTINGGELRNRTTTNALPTTTTVTVNSGAFWNLNNVSQSVVGVQGQGNVGTGGATLTLTGNTNTVLGGALKNIANAGAGAVTTGNGRLVKNGSGVITFNGLNDINGSVTLSAGGITVGATGSLCGDIADVIVNGGTLTLNQAAEKIENLSGTGGTIELNNAALSLISDPVASTSFAGTISGSGGLTRQNANATTRTLTLTGTNTYDGNTIVDKGIIAVGNASALGSTTGYTQVTATGAEVLFTGAATNFTVDEPLRIAGTGATNGGAISVIASATPTLSGPVTLIGDTTIAVSSTAALTLSNANAITSTANENLTLQGGSGAGAGGAISGAIALGTGSLTKLQTGTWTLSGSNTYSGGTTISAGTLKANNTTGSATGSGAVTINSGGTLAGSGAVAGDVMVNSGGNVSPGNSIESLNVGGNLSFAANSTFVAEIDTSVALTSGADLLNVGGSLSIAPGALLDLSDIAAVSTQIPVIFTKLTLMSYDATLGWDGGTFAGVADDSYLIIGANTFFFDYDDTTPGVNFPLDTPLSLVKYVTITAVPEPTAFVFGGLTCGLIGLGYFRRKYIARRAGIAT